MGFHCVAAPSSPCPAYERWITGALAPYRITRALNAAPLYTATGDGGAYGAAGAAVDGWEAGTCYPSFEQPWRRLR
ncbi:hypothetical protein [Rhodococcus qingshengii]|uniref:hypothetical protein n=1 Tax=Rhodococcus qingshengii TaxID=334542 RepID=UPI001BE4E7CF|nr:hypothetical protein [Rhodococcus qingshengii]MBT2274424.1 hypothetical protein [Rhodococcus qingshengii]